MTNLLICRIPLQALQLGQRVHNLRIGLLIHFNFYFFRRLYFFKYAIEIKQLDKGWQRNSPKWKITTVHVPCFLKAPNKFKFNYLASAMDPSPKILVRMGVEKRVNTARRLNNPPASSFIDLSLMLLLESKLMIMDHMLLINSLNP